MSAKFVCPQNNIKRLIKMKQMKLVAHQPHYSEESLLISHRDFPDLKIGDIIEICPEDELRPLLFQITSFFEDLAKETISMEQSLLNNFHFRQYSDVTVSQVNPKDVALDSVELFFKDQYLGRSDMWRLKKILTNTSLIVNKKIDIFDIRCHVFELWAHGERVTSGLVTEDTKIVYRSASSMFYLFIQMSSEMWEFDINGELYIEKAFNGFLHDLFDKWKMKSCNHDVTIVLFSRTFYKASRIEEFPEDMKECLHQDYRGRFYEDYYRVAVQNERFDDWSNTLVLLKKLFLQYQSSVLEYHQRRLQPEKVPPAYNSTASKGNFLEVLNMSLNVFEKHYMDRSFDRTGQLSVVISPGVGVFEVDRELANITKQRTIDNGIGSDLVCLGEQPYHAVPLFKFHNKHPTPSSCAIGDDYNMPHWINLSFYSSPKQFNYSNFVPRIKLPSPKNITQTEHHKEFVPKVGHFSLEGFEDSPKDLKIPFGDGPQESTFGLMFNHDEYDAQVFNCPHHSRTPAAPSGGVAKLAQTKTRKKSTPPVLPSGRYRKLSEDSSIIDMSPKLGAFVSSPAIAIPGTLISPPALSASLGSNVLSDQDVSPPTRSMGGSSSPYESSSLMKPTPRKTRALINPFNPSRVTIKLTSNRRRWTHVFPLGPTGIFMQQHHYQAIPHNQGSLLPTDRIHQAPRKYRLPQDHPDMFAEVTEWEQRHQQDTRLLPTSASSVSLASSGDSWTRTGNRTTSRQNSRNLTWMWGVTGEQEWTPAITTGVDWKSLVIPACLPITTDYYPDETTLETSYEVSGDQSLLPEDIGLDLGLHRCFRGAEESKHFRALNALETFSELICQRLQQGFQIILTPKKSSQNTEETWMSIGRIFHRLVLKEPDTISVTQYRPRHPYLVNKSYHYSYRFHAPDSLTYGVSWVDFTSEMLEKYMWNYLEFYICTRGDGIYELHDGLKFWRLRLLLLPGVQTATRQIIDGHCSHCDIYTPLSPEECANQREGFIKVFEAINRIRLSVTNRSKPKTSGLSSASSSRRFSLGQTLSNPNLPAFRERLGSNKMHDRPRSRTALARSDGGSGRVSPAIAAETLFGNVPTQSAVMSSAPLSKNSGSNSSLERVQESGIPAPAFSSTEDVLQIGVESAFRNLSQLSGFADIVESMKNSNDGLPFIIKQPGLPPHTFISFYAVFWIKDRIQGIEDEEQAFRFLKKMHEAGFIVHASGNPRIPVNFGLHLYCLCTPPSKDGDNKPAAIDDEDYKTFQKEWLQVDLPLFTPLETPTDIEDLVEPVQKSLRFNQSNLEIETGAKSERIEWGHIKFHNHFQPGEAYEIVLEWMVATGNRVAELVQNWCRRASNVGLQLVPLPSDPFALPFSFKSDPLRGPIFIPLQLDCLPEAALLYLKDERLLQFQEDILSKFGFLPHRDPNAQKNGRQQYAHISGSIFVLILVISAGNQCSSTILGQTPTPSAEAIASGSHEDYITRHYTRVKKSEFCVMTSGAEYKVGFLWAWNYMITKRWKSPATGDENFMRKVMANFRAFCSNHGGRLVAFWQSLEESCYRHANQFLNMEV